MATISTPYEKPPRRFDPFWIGVAIFVALLVAFIAIFDWNWLRGPLARYYSHKTGRDVHISHLDVHPWSFQPRVTIDELTISNPDWAPKGDTASIPKLSVTMKLLPLFIGRLILPRVVVDQRGAKAIRRVVGHRRGPGAVPFGQQRSDERALRRRGFFGERRNSVSAAYRVRYGVGERERQRHDQSGQRNAQHDRTGRAKEHQAGARTGAHHHHGLAEQAVRRHQAGWRHPPKPVRRWA